MPGTARTILPSSIGCWPTITRPMRAWLCVDCGLDTAPGWPGSPHPGDQVVYDDDCEVYIVRKVIWQRAGDPAGCLCVGCLERRIGRKLKPKDFDGFHIFNEMPCTPRLRSRRKQIGRAGPVRLTVEAEDLVGAVGQ